MADARNQRKPTFLWQGLLIVLPVVVLAAVGAFSLRQDRAIARHEATERAQIIADELARKIWAEITETIEPTPLTEHCFQVGPDGQLIFPPPYSPVPTPKLFDESVLRPEQARLWRRLQSTKVWPENLAGLAQAYRDFLDSDPPENFAAAACYGLGLVLNEQQQFPEATEMFGEVVATYPNAVGESGLPLLPLAELKLLELQPHETTNMLRDSSMTKRVEQGNADLRRLRALQSRDSRDVSFPPILLEHFVSLDGYCSNLVHNPTLLTPLLLGTLQERWVMKIPTGPNSIDNLMKLTRAPTPKMQEAIQKWQNTWSQHERSREFFQAARAHLATNTSLSPRLFWFDTPSPLSSDPAPAAIKMVADQRWLAVGFDDFSSIGTAGSSSRAAAPVSDSVLEFLTTNQTAVVATPRAVTLDNETANLSATRATPVFKSSEGRNVFVLASVQGAAVPVQQLERRPNSQWFVCFSESALCRRVVESVSPGSSAISWSSPTTITSNYSYRASAQMPDYFAVGVELAGRDISGFGLDRRVWRYGYYIGKGTGQKKKEFTEEKAATVLASAAKAEAGKELLKVSVFLSSPDGLYARQRARTFWFGALIAVSAASALIGLAAAWRAFNRQQRLGEMKSNFVSSVSHELRAPIASVRLLAESLERGKISEPVRQNEYFRFIGQECRRLSSLIENVLDFSRIEQGRKQYEFEPTDLRALVEQTVKLMAPYATERGVALKFEMPALRSSRREEAHSDVAEKSEPPHVGCYELNVDGRAMQQALVNLIDNAIKHSPKGESVTVEILDATRNTQHAPGLTPDTPHLALSVSDHGPGIPASEHEKIFERFYRLGSELRRETQGVGIGLSIVKHIIVAHGGRVRVESEVGKGSRFTIELPKRTEPRMDTDEHG